MKNVREVNSYRLVFLPDHPRAMKNDNWNGYVYEHIAVAEDMLGRSLRDDEVIHHLDLNRSNNRKENLLVLERGQHAKLHAWLDKGAPGVKASGGNGENSGKAKVKEPSYCLVCGTTLQEKQRKCCSVQCSRIFSRKVIRPSKEELTALLQTASQLAIGRLFGVSNTAVKKWAREYGITKPTLSRATDTSVEGAETSGAVKPA